MPMATPEAQREYQRLWMAKRRSDFFADKICAHCGGTENLELDHIDPKLKVTHAIWSWSRIRREVEIAKCQILCHKCHKKKTTDNKENARGTQIGISKLTPEKVLLIREKFEEGATKRGLAREFGVNDRTIRVLLNGETWRHV